MPTHKECIDEYCKGHCYDPDAAGTWREQVAVNCSPTCPFYDVRPVPRHCLIDGKIDIAAVGDIARKLDRITERQAGR